MAVYLFTFHAYLSWMPDRKRGYVKRGEGILPADPETADFYRGNAKDDEVVFTPDVQQVLVTAAQILCEKKTWTLHQVMTDRTHVHTLVSWRAFLEWEKVRRALKYQYSNDLNRTLGSRPSWFAEAGSRKRVRDREHLNYLMDEYLPKHDGVYWRNDGKTREDCREMARKKKGKR